MLRLTQESHGKKGKAEDSYSGTGQVEEDQL